MKRWTIFLASLAALAVAGYVVTAQQPRRAGEAPDDQPTRRDRSAREDGKEARAAQQAPAKSGIVSEFNKDPDSSGFVLRSSEVAEGGMLPEEFTGDGSSATLPLQWSGAPLGTQSFSLIMHHEAPDGLKWYWVLYNIPADVTSLPKNVKGIGTLGNNSVNRNLGYAPPHSKGPGPKKYTLTVYALSAVPKITVPADQVSRDVLLAAMKDSLLATADLNVIYSRGEQAPEGGPRSASKQAGPPPAKTSLGPAAPGRRAGGEGQARPEDPPQRRSLDEGNRPRPADQPEPPGDAEMTPAQITQVKAILSKYDEASLTAADARAINEAFREAGLRNGPALQQAVRDAGFVPEKIGELDPPPDRPGEEKTPSDKPQPKAPATKNPTTGRATKP